VKVPGKAVVIGLDGVAWHLLDPLIEDDVMPRLGAIKAGAAWGELTSTVPTYTPPAWTSAVTGVNPGRHGIYGFYAGNAQAERQELMHAGRIRSATLWEMANAQKATTGIYNLPLSYPPQALDGWMISGMMTPGFSEKIQGFAHPSELADEVLSWAPGYQVDTSANWERDYRDDALCVRAFAVLEQRKTVLERLLQQRPVDIVFSVLESPDRLQHVYYRYLDRSSPLYGTSEGAAIRPALLRCYRLMDDIVGLLDDYAGGSGAALVCSDHGFTAWESSVHTNALLERWGYLRIKPAAKAMQTKLARSMVPLAKRALPARLAREAKGATFAAIDWSKTKAFASPIPQQGIFINLKGRERFGCVEPVELETLKDEITAALTSLTGPDGRPLVDVVHRSEQVFSGQALEGAPDLLPVMRDHRFELDDEVFHKEPFHDLSHLPRGVHHPAGVIAVRAPEVNRGAHLEGSVMDVTPTLLHLAGLKVPDDLDGTVLESAFSPSALEQRPISYTTAISSSGRQESSPYSKEEEAAIEESLRGLGYL
jgi:predicted AlkP superfamily phosphohydrolase/phosphomutase